LRNAEGEVIGASKIARDITERKRAEQVIRETQERLAEANAELERRVEERTASLREAVAQMEEFSYTVSHDLRAPLRAMQGYSKALMEDFGSDFDPEAQQYLKRIVNNASRLDKMILDVLTYARIARDELRMEVVALDRLVRDMILQYPEMQYPAAVITVQPLQDVMGHEPSLAQAVSNLLRNAIKFVAPGVIPRVTVWTERRGEEIRLWVEDNGIGIAPKHHSRLFCMFERIHPKMPYEGTGVGLAVTRKAIERMGGKVGVESDGVQGSRFWIQLPAPNSTNELHQ
jgi:signal transduction histidine kinase